MKKALSILLAFCMLSHALVNVGIGLYYDLNKTYISQKLCENRNNPAMHCNGHCYLSKQLKKAEEGENKSQSQTIKDKEEVLISQHEGEGASYIPVFRETGLAHEIVTSIPDFPFIEIAQPPKIVAC